MSTRSFPERDRSVLWHPFTQMDEWRGYEPIVVERGEGFHLIDTSGRRYLDGVSSIWCNVHGYGHPEINAAMKAQIDRLSHSTLLGLSHRPAIELAERVTALLPEPLGRVFYSDSGSTAVEVALRIAFQSWRLRGRPEKQRFVSLRDAYHGDTIGSVSLGYSEPFHSGYEPLTFPTLKLDPPYLCPPIGGRGACDAVSLEAAAGESLRRLEHLLSDNCDELAAVFTEPLVQGAAGIWPQPPSYLRGIRALCDRYDVLWVCDEVATGFGRTGSMFAIDHAGVVPDLLCLAKGLSGGMLPVAMTVTTEALFECFSGPYEEYRTLFHGHTYGGNPLGCAAGLASLDVFEREQTVEQGRRVAKALESALAEHVSPLAHAGPVRQVGTMVGFDLLRDPETGEQFPASERRAHSAVLHAREESVIIRPLADTMILMPSLAMPDALVEELVRVTGQAVRKATS